MSLDRLGQQFDASAHWKRALAAVLVRYRSWLAANRLGTPALEARLERSLRLLRSEQDSGVITLLDRRVVTQRYGKAILNALPPFRRQID